MPLQTQPYKGARDYYPEDKRLQKYIFGKLRETVEKFGYEEYDAPLLEPLEIYTAKTGDEIVNEQTYTFTDRGDRKVVIRPEMTPSVSRMVAAKRQELNYPLRLYNIGTRWRYERPQRGRTREFWQLDVDLFGVDDLAAEVEIIQVADWVMQNLGAERNMYEIRFNSRKLIDIIFDDYLGLDGVQKMTLMKLVDRMPKMEPAQFSSEADALFTPSQRESGNSDKLADLLKIKELKDLPKELIEKPPAKKLAKLMTGLTEKDISNLSFDLSIMRGFDYYTDVVFEVFDSDPENNRSMFGGGRYDGLVELFGVEPLDAVGFAMGDAPLVNFLKSHQLIPELRPETDLFVVIIGELSDRADKAVDELREMGLNVARGNASQKLDKQIKTAVSKKVNYVLFIGEVELKDEQFTLKNLQTGAEEKHSLQRIVSIVKDYRQQ